MTINELIIILIITYQLLQYTEITHIKDDREAAPFKNGGGGGGQ